MAGQRRPSAGRGQGCADFDYFPQVITGNALYACAHAPGRPIYIVVIALTRIRCWRLRHSSRWCCWWR